MIDRLTKLKKPHANLGYLNPCSNDPNEWARHYAAVAEIRDELESINARLLADNAEKEAKLVIAKEALRGIAHGTGSADEYQQCALNTLYDIADPADGREVEDDDPGLDGTMNDRSCYPV